MMAASLTPIKRPPSDLARKLREMADSADAGRLTDIVTIYVEDDNFEFRIGTSKLQAIAMASMLHEQTLNHMKE